MLAVCQYLWGSLRVLAGRVPPALELRARRKQLKCSEIPVENRDTLNLLRGKDGRHVGPVSLQLRNFSCNFNRLSDSTDLQRRISTDRCVGVNANTHDIVGLKSGGLDSDSVTVGDQVRNGVVPALVRGCFFRRALSDVCHRALGPSRCVPLRLGHCSNIASIHSLPYTLPSTKPHPKTHNPNPTHNRSLS